jgi:peptide/nickel transport system substrate-binding protein
LGGALLAATSGLLPARAQKPDDKLRIAWRDAIADLDFYYNPLRTSLILSHHVWDTLVYRDPETFQIKPLLATAWRFVDDTMLEFDLRPGVTFHDGGKFSADDVVYTVDLVLDDPQLAVPSNYAFIDGAEKVDELKVRIHLKQVFPAALEYFAMVLPIYPAAYRERAGAGFAKSPVGTGPYRVTRVDEAVEIDLERNDAYFDGPKGKPAIRWLVIKEVADPAAEIDQLFDGQADWIWQISADQLPKIDATANLQSLTEESMRVAYLNMDAAGRTGAENPLTNLKVRQAIMSAVDRQTMARRFMAGGARVLDAPCYPTQFGCDQAVATKYDYNPDRARTLLAEAGFSGGFDTELVTYVLPEWSQALQTYLGAVGIRVRVSQLQTGAVVQRSAEGKNPLEAGSWGSYSINDASAFLPFFFGGGGSDYARDAEVIRLVGEGGATTDTDRRRAAYSAAIRRITAQAYFMPLFTSVTTYAMSRQLNFKTFRDELPRFYLASWK